MKQEKLWADYLQIYDTVITNSILYRRLMRRHLLFLDKANVVLDSGAGTGVLAVELLKRGKVVYAHEPNTFAREILRKRSGLWDKNLYVSSSETKRLPFKDGTFDAVNSLLVFHFVRNPTAYLNELYRVLKKEGVLVMSSRSAQEPSKRLSEKVFESFYRSLCRKGMDRIESQDAIDRFQTLRKKMINARLLRNISSGKTKESLLKEVGFRRVKVAGYSMFHQHVTIVAVK